MIALLPILFVAFVAVLIADRARTHSRKLAAEVSNDRDARALLERKVKNLSFGIDAIQAQLMRHENASGGFWVTGNGTVLRIRDMSDAHIEQAIAYCKEKKTDSVPLRAERSRRRRNRRLS